MTLCAQRDVGVLNPEFTANSNAFFEFRPRRGKLKRIDFSFYGDHTTLITASGQTDGESNIYAAFRVTTPMIQGPNIIHDILVRDNKFVTHFLDGALSEHLNPLADGGAHQGRFSVHYAPPKRWTPNPDDWGLNTDELSGPIRIEVLYGAVTSIGPSATVITNKTRISECVELFTPGAVPSAFVFSYQQNRLVHDSDAILEDVLGTGNMERIAGIFFRQHDNSATAAQRVDGLITRIKTRHEGEEIADDQWLGLKQRTQQQFGLDRTDYPVGIAVQMFTDDFNPRDMLPAGRGRSLTVVHDSVETVPDSITNVAPAANDALYAIVLGMNFSARGRSRGRGAA